MDAHTPATNGEIDGIEIRSSWLDRVCGSHWTRREVEMREGSQLACVECAPRRRHPGSRLMRVRRTLGIEGGTAAVPVLGAVE